MAACVPRDSRRASMLRSPRCPLCPQARRGSNRQNMTVGNTSYVSHRDAQPSQYVRRHVRISSSRNAWQMETIVFCKLMYAATLCLPHAPHPGEEGACVCWHGLGFLRKISYRPILQEIRACLVHAESSHGRAAAKFSEFMTCGAQYLTGSMTLKVTVRATLPT